MCQCQLQYIYELQLHAIYCPVVVKFGPKSSQEKLKTMIELLVDNTSDNTDRSLSFARLHQRQQFSRRGEVLLALFVQSDTATTSIVTATTLRALHQL